MTKKKAAYYYSLLEEHQGRSLWQCYENPSNEKKDAYFRLLEFYRDNKVFILLKCGVVSYNTFNFTMAFLVEFRGNLKHYLIIETRDKTDYYEID